MANDILTINYLTRETRSVNSPYEGELVGVDGVELYLRDKHS